MLQKCRAWHIRKQVMCDVIKIDFKQGIVTLDLETDDYEYYWMETDWNFDEVILMQSTGLKDKYDMEIFEGDIVVNHVGDEWVITHFRGAFRYYPIESFANAEEHWFETDNIGNFYTEGFEVIGNIYKNPELMEVAE